MRNRSFVQVEETSVVVAMPAALAEVPDRDPLVVGLVYGLVRAVTSQ